MSQAPALADALGPLRADPRRAAVLLDVDGTLAPIVRHAERAQVPESTRTLLAEVARRYGVVACVTGRRASDARSMVSIGTISYLGTHGTELLRAGWAEPKLEPEVEEWVRRIQ
ncbi:MAG TPA: trehalose-phosphatase, partial [Solirubrobacteraceae bacterium]